MSVTAVGPERPPGATDRVRTLHVIAWGVLALVALLTVGALFLGVRNGTFSSDPSTLITVLVMFAYASIGLFLTLRLPYNVIGWLFLLTGMGIILGGFGSEYARFGLVTEPGSLPFPTAAAWVQSWSFFAATAIPLILVLFPTGRVLSPGWRWLPRALVLSVAILVLCDAVRPGAIDVGPGVQPVNPLGVEALRQVTSVLNWIAGLALALCSMLSAVALFARYRRSTGDERQQLRWFTAAAAVALVLFVAVLVTSIGLAPGETRFANDLAFILFFIAVGIGLPVAAAVALVKYRLYDLDVVVRKTVVFAITVGLLMLAGLAAVVVATGSVTLATDQPSAFAAAGFAVGVLVWPLWRLARTIADRVVYGGRTTPYEALTEFSDRLAEAYATDDVLPRMAAVLAESTRAAEAHVWLLVGSSFRRAATSRPDAGPAIDVTDELRVPATGDDLPTFPDVDHAVEVRHRGDLLGALTVVSRPNDPIESGRQGLMRDLASQAGIVLRNVRLIEELRASRQRLVAAQDEERRRIERNIHDGVQQRLVALNVQLGLLARIAERDPAAVAKTASDLQVAATETLEDLRDLARGIYPPLLADQGLGAALEAQARRAAVPVRVACRGVGRYDRAVESAIYFCVLEALNNVAKYASATAATVEVAEDDGAVTFTVDDDGVGFDTTVPKRGTGLVGMADRLEAVDGTFTIRSELGGGSTVRGTAPARPPEDGSSAPDPAS